MVDTKISQLSVLTATPDLLDQRLVPALLARLSQQRVSVVGAMPHVFSAPAAAELYAGRVTHQRTEPRLHAGWLNPRLFTAGPSLILFLRSDGASPPLVDLVREMKGSSRLGEHRPEHLRSLSPLTDRGFSLVHTPDDVEGVLHEIRLLLGERAVAELLAEGRPAVRPDEVISILPGVPLTAEAHPFDILPRVVAQVAATCACAPMNSGIAEPAGRLFDEVRRCRDRLNRQVVDKTLEEELWRAMAAMEEPLRQLVTAQRAHVDWALPPMDLRRALRAAALLTAVASACLEERFTVLECEAMIEALHACHLNPSYWDEHRLRLIAAYHRRTPSSSHA